jgi:hypothetical protein
MTRHVVVRDFDRTYLAIAEGLAALGSSTVHEADGRRGVPRHRSGRSRAGSASPARP